FKDISITLEKVAAKTNVNHLAVSVSQGMSSHWLMPRISNFRHLHPEADGVDGSYTPAFDAP
ncbi:MAG: hypothetical protein AAGD43_37720, partial [Pseudomonadota bacterium]